ncbi:MAG TPA: hypothetical protein VGD08_24660 [Stellaceae bacterium]|jgi:hypothetical protein
MSITAIGTSAAGVAGYAFQRPASPTQPSGQNASAASDQVKNDFLKFARMSPAERIRDAYLRAHGLTEDDLKAMSPEKRKAIEDEIQKEIKDSIQRNTEKKTGLVTDLHA